MASSSEFFGDRLQNALYSRIAAGVFPAVFYVDGLRETNHSLAIAPVGLQVHFTDSRFRRGLECDATHVRADWNMVAYVAFAVPVTVEGFEIDYLKDPVRVYNDDTGEGYMVELKQIRYDEPPELGKAPMKVVASFVATQIQI